MCVAVGTAVARGGAQRELPPVPTRLMARLIGRRPIAARTAGANVRAPRKGAMCVAVGTAGTHGCA